MVDIDRKSENNYKTCVTSLSDIDLDREIWSLDEHIKYRNSPRSADTILLISLLKIAISEKDGRRIKVS